MAKGFTKGNNKKERKFLLRQLYFYLTEGCNLHCRHCWIAPKFQTQKNTYPSLTFDLFISIIKQAIPLGLSRVKLTGGEPLLHPQIEKILDAIKAQNIRLVLETNGILCAPELAQKIAECDNPFVSVSLDGANAETHEWMRGVKGCFDATLEGIRNLVQAGVNPQIIMTITRRNKDQVKAVLGLAESLGAKSLKFNILQPTARGSQLHQEHENLNAAELLELGRWVENSLAGSTDLRLSFDYPLAFSSLNHIFSENGEGCGSCGILGILGVLSDGSYALCGIGETVPELIFGHASRENLEDVWNNTMILQELRRGLPNRLEGICGNCLMKELCLGSCIAQNYLSNKNLWEPYWFCQELHNKGLFPQTRFFNNTSHAKKSQGNSNNATGHLVASN